MGRVAMTQVIFSQNTASPFVNFAKQEKLRHTTRIHITSDKESLSQIAPFIIHFWVREDIFAGGWRLLIQR